MCFSHIDHIVSDRSRTPHLFFPNLLATRGHGTYMEEDKLVASVAGVVERVNKLISVRPLKSRYTGEVGDVVVGRVLEVAQKRWRVDTGSKLHSILNLSSIMLPGGELRRRSAQDERMMRDFFKERDLISAEVQAVHHDGTLSLHTRSMKYGKLRQGTLLCVSPNLVKRCKTHFHNVLCGAGIILGNNGWVWISPQVVEEGRQALYGGQLDSSQSENTGGQEDRDVSLEERKTIARLHNCILALARQNIQLYDTTIQYTFDASLKYEVKDLLTKSVVDDITTAAAHLDAE